MAALQRKIRIGHLTFSVFAMDHAKALRDDLYGHCDTAWQRIAIDTMVSGDRQREVLLHDVLHAVFADYGLRTSVLDEHYEHVVDVLSSGLAAVIAANTAFGAFLTARD